MSGHFNFNLFFDNIKHFFIKEKHSKWWIIFSGKPILFIFLLDLNFLVLIGDLLNLKLFFLGYRLNFLLKIGDHFYTDIVFSKKFHYSFNVIVIYFGQNTLNKDARINLWTCFRNLKKVFFFRHFKNLINSATAFFN